MTRHDPARLLRRLEPPSPPRDLRARALAGARASAPLPAPPDPWRRLLESRPLRLAWAAAVLILLAAHLLLTVPAGTASAPAWERELAAVVDLPAPALGRLPTPDGRPNLFATSERSHTDGT